MMHIKKLKLENFKSYKKIDVDLNPKLNMIIGENNIGKTTIFDAMLLWEMAYKLLITAKGKSFYKKSSYNSMNITFNKLLIFRIVNAADLFYNAAEKMSIAIIISNGELDFNLKITFGVPDIADSYIRITNDENLGEFHHFAKYCEGIELRLTDAISINFTKPISFIDREELFLNRAQVHRKSSTGKNYEILRNKILNTQTKKFEYLEGKLENILGKSVSFSYKNLNRDEDEFIKLEIKIGDNSKSMDLSLVGSGVLHLIEIFASLFVKEKNEKGLNLILIDEPDSHLHSDLQAKVIEELKKDEHRQIFIISHNERILSQVRLGELFYINRWSKKSGSLLPAQINDFKTIKNNLGGKLVELESYHDSKPMLFVEGDSDKAILQKAFKLFDSTLLEKIQIKSSGGYNGVKDNLIGWSFLNKDKIAIGLFDYDHDTNQAIEDCRASVPIHNEKIKIINLDTFKPEHLRNFFSNGLKIPFAIEEMFNTDIWGHFREQDWLEEKNDVVTYNSGVSILHSFKEHCLEQGVVEENLIYLHKVKLLQKANASKYLCSIATVANFASMRPIVEKIKNIIS